MEENIVSSVKTTEAADGARLEQIAPEKPPVSGGRKAGLIVGIVVGVLALAYIAACAVVQFLYNDTALPHTDVLGVDVSGQAAQQIEALWEQQGERVLHDTAVTLTESDERIGAVMLEELGVTVTPQAAAVAAGASRRYESWGGGALAWLRGGYELIRSWFVQTSAVPALDVDQSALDAACEKLAASLNCTVVDGGYRLEKGEGLYITKPADGRMLDAPQLESDLAAMLQSGELTPVACVYEEKKAQTVDVQAIHDQLAGEKVEAVCDKETGKPTESRVGLSFDVTAVQAQLDAAPAGTEFLADAEVEFPTVSTEELEECMFRDVLGTYTTKCAGPWGRHQNIKLLAAAGMTAALVSTSGCMVSIQFDRSKRQLPQKLSSADEKTWAAEPVWVSSGEAGVLTKESQAFESEFESESEKESESEQGTAEITEKESESPTESTTADSFVIPLPPQVG